MTVQSCDAASVGGYAGDDRRRRFAKQPIPGIGHQCRAVRRIGIIRIHHGQIATIQLTHAYRGIGLVQRRYVRVIMSALKIGAKFRKGSWFTLEEMTAHKNAARIQIVRVTHKETRTRIWLLGVASRRIDKQHAVQPEFSSYMGQREHADLLTKATVDEGVLRDCAVASPGRGSATHSPSAPFTTRTTDHTAANTSTSVPATIATSANHSARMTWSAARYSIMSGDLSVDQRHQQAQQTPEQKDIHGRAERLHQRTPITRLHTGHAPQPCAACVTMPISICWARVARLAVGA